MGVPTWFWIWMGVDTVGILAPLVIIALIEFWFKKKPPVVDMRDWQKLERALQINLLAQEILAADSSYVLLMGTTPLTGEQAGELAERMVDAVNHIPALLDNKES